MTKRGDGWGEEDGFRSCRELTSLAETTPGAATVASRAMARKLIFMMVAIEVQKVGLVDCERCAGCFHDGRRCLVLHSSQRRNSRTRVSSNFRRADVQHCQTIYNESRLCFHLLPTGRRVGRYSLHWYHPTQCSKKHSVLHLLQGALLSSHSKH